MELNYCGSISHEYMEQILKNEVKPHLRVSWCTAGADAAYEILNKFSVACTGNTFIDEAVLRNEGVTNFDKYAVMPGGKLFGDLYVG